MSLNLDILRSVLLHIEKNLTVCIDEDNFVSSNSLDIAEILEFLTQKHKKSEAYSRESLLYAIKMLSDGGFINDCITVGAGGDWAIGTVYDITFAGHEFLEYIRENSNWKKIKENAAKVGCYSLGLLCQIGSSVVSGLLTKQFGI